MIDSLNDLSVDSVEWFYVMEDFKITDPTFKVRIPKLMSSLSSDSIKDEVLSVDTGCLLNSSECMPKVSNTLTSANYIVAENMTDYRTEHFGEIYMESVKHTTDDGPESPLKHKKEGPHSPHNHTLSEEFTGYNVRYYKLNDVSFKKGKKVLGVYINKSIDDIGVIHIPQAVKLGG